MALKLINTILKYLFNEWNEKSLFVSKFIFFFKMSCVMNGKKIVHAEYNRTYLTSPNKCATTIFYKNSAEMDDLPGSG